MTQLPAAQAGFNQLATELAMQRAELLMLKGVGRSEAIDKAVRLYEYLMYAAGFSDTEIAESTTRSVLKEFLSSR